MSGSLVVHRALLSVSDKTGLVDFAAALHRLGVHLLSTGGTAETLRRAGIPVQEVSDYTQFPEMMNGRLKTLHPRIHGGLLGRRGIDDAAMAANDILPIDLVVANLYPFKTTIDKPETTLEEAIENIDIGGPTMLRAAAKNYSSVGVVVSPSDYPDVLHALENQAFSIHMRERLALKTFEHTALYDREIANYLGQKFSNDSLLVPETLTLNFKRQNFLRYGENPHQQAAFYAQENSLGLAAAKQLQGKEISYNNLNDADAALHTVIRFSEPACVIVKHANPCGAAIGEDLLSAYDRAHRCDPTSAFGGIIAFNRSVDEIIAKEIISRQFVEVLLAPAFTDEALLVLRQKQNIRVLEVKASNVSAPELQLTSIHGGLLVQEWDNLSLQNSDLKIVTEREPTADEVQNLLFAWRVVRTVKSNAIVLAKDLATIGIGSGQTSRIYSSKIAVTKAADEGLDTHGCVLASDAFFPFRDGVDVAAAAGAKAIIQPGGSIRDQEVINAANEYGMAMIFTGIRHFKH